MDEGKLVKDLLTHMKGSGGALSDTGWKKLYRFQKVGEVKQRDGLGNVAGM